MIYTLANVGVPMIIPQMTLMGFALLPIVIIETFIISKHINLPLPKILLDVGIANIYDSNRRSYRLVLYVCNRIN